MEYRYFATQQTLSDIKRKKFGSMAMARLNRYLTSTEENVLNVRTISDNLIENTRAVGAIRFFWLIYEKKDITVYVLRKMFRHDQNYDNLQFHELDQKKKMLNDFSLSEDERKQVEGFINSIISDSSFISDISLPKPILSASEHDFISTPLTINHNMFEMPIFEHKGWIQYVKTASDSFLQEFLEKFYNYIIETPHGTFEWDTIIVGTSTVDVYKANKAYYIYDVRKGKNDAYPTSKNPGKEYGRCYPSKFLESPILWAKMEKDEKSNLFLTDDQLEVVSSSNNANYPLFITGRAGSGKSTMLQYLFAEVILRYLTITKGTNSNLLPPIYLSYSRELIKNAKKNLTTLFEDTAVYTDEIKNWGIDFSDDITPYLYVPENNTEEKKKGMMLYTFRDLVQVCARSVNDNILKEQFTDKKHWDYTDFEVEWQKQFGRNQTAVREYGPSISWYIIRTFIKGWNSEDYLDWKKYEHSAELNGRRTVLSSTYKKVFENVWEKWYKKETTSVGDEKPRHWDDQDLIRWCLQTDSIDEMCSALYCDESQDFTRVELEFLLNISSLANRTISSVDDIQKYPFVFVGDEYQTLNPTGFSWESLHDCFWKYLKEQTRCKDITLPQDRNLNQNHRSLSPIVNFSNRIQLLRASRFNEKIEPQDYHYEGILDVVCCPCDNKRIWDAMAKAKMTVILPLSEEESQDRNHIIVNDYPELKNFLHEDITFLTPAEAKGNEYPHVALYGFSDKHGMLNIDSLLRWFKSGNNSNESEEAKIPLKFDITNAYVAATRAEERLYLLGKPTRESIWSFAFDAFNCDEEDLKKLGQEAEELKLLMLNSINNRSSWENKIGHFIYEEFPDFGDGNTTFYENLKNLEELESGAHTKYQYDKIARFYHNAGNSIGEHRCYAKGYEKERDYSSAAKEYIKAQLDDKAVACIWQSIASSSCPIEDAIVSLSQITGCESKRNHLLTEIASLSTQQSVKLAAIIVILNKVLSSLEDSLDNDDLKQWSEFLNYCLHKLSVSNASFDRFSELCTCYDSLLRKGIHLDSMFLASKAYECQSYESAIKFWESEKKTIYPTNYYRAKVRTLPYPEVLLYYKGTEDPYWYYYAVSECRKNGDWQTLLSKQDYRDVLFSAIRLEPSAGVERFDILPYILAYSMSSEIANNNLIKYRERKDSKEINYICIESLINAQFNLLSGWLKPKESFVQNDANRLLDAICFLQKLQGEDGPSYIERELEKVNHKLIDFCRNHKQYLNTCLGYVIFIELGKLISERGKHFDTMKFYEQASKIMDSNLQKHNMQIGRLAFMEKYAETRKGLDDQEVTRAEAYALRSELGVTGDAKLPLIQVEDWVSVYKRVCTFSSQIKEKTASVQEDEPQNTVRSDQDHSDKTPFDVFRFCYGDYKIIYNHRKGELELRDEDDANGKFVNGSFGENDDFILKNGQILYREDEVETPFMIKIKNKTISFHIQTKE